MLVLLQEVWRLEDAMQEGVRAEKQIVDYCRQVACASAEEEDSGYLLRDPSCAAVRAVLVWARWSETVALNANEESIVDSCLKEALLLASEDAAMVTQLIIDAGSAWSNILQSENALCFQGVQELILREASKVDSIEEAESGDRALYARLRQSQIAVLLKLSSSQVKTRARQGLLVMVTRLIEQPLTRVFLFSHFWFRTDWPLILSSQCTLSTEYDLVYAAAGCLEQIARAGPVPRLAFRIVRALEKSLINLHASRPPSLEHALAGAYFQLVTAGTFSHQLHSCLALATAARKRGLPPSASGQSIFQKKNTTPAGTEEIALNLAVVALEKNEKVTTTAVHMLIDLARDSVATRRSLVRCLRKCQQPIAFHEFPDPATAFYKFALGDDASYELACQANALDAALLKDDTQRLRQLVLSAVPEDQEAVAMALAAIRVVHTLETERDWKLALRFILNDTLPEVYPKQANLFEVASRILEYDQSERAAFVALRLLSTQQIKESEMLTLATAIGARGADSPHVAKAILEHAGVEHVSDKAEYWSALKLEEAAQRAKGTQNWPLAAACAHRWLEASKIDALSLEWTETLDIAVRGRDGRTMAIGCQALGAVLKAEGMNYSKLGSWALAELASRWGTRNATSYFSGLAYAELRHYEVRRRVAGGVADASKLQLLTEAELATYSGEETTESFVAGSAPPAGELVLLIKQLATVCTASSLVTKGSAFPLLRALGSLVFRPRLQGESLNIASLMTQNNSTDKGRNVEGMALLVAAFPGLVARRDERTLRCLGGELKQIAKHRTVEIIAELLLQYSVLASQAERDNVTAFILRELFDGKELKAVLTRRTDSLVARLASELSGHGRGHAAWAALEIVAEAHDTPLDAYLAEKFLMIVTGVVQNGWRNVSCDSRCARLRVAATCFETLPPAAAARFAPKVLSIFSTALSDDQKLNIVAVDALQRYTRRLESDALRLNLAAIVVALEPVFTADTSCPALPAARSLICELLTAETDLTVVDDETLATIPRLLDECDGAQKIWTEALQRRAQNELERLSDLLEHESPQVQLAAVEELSKCLELNPETIRKLEPCSGRASSRVAALLAALLRLARRSKSAETRLKVALAKCLGDLGAIDPSRIEASDHFYSGSSSSIRKLIKNPPRRDSEQQHLRTTRSQSVRAASEASSAASSDADFGSLNVVTPPWREHCDELAARMICDFLVPTIREGSDHIGQDRAAYCIQELLKVVCPRTKKTFRQLPNWARRRFQYANCLELVEPYVKTDYVIGNSSSKLVTSAIESANARREAVAARYLSTASRWLGNWCRSLAERSKSTKLAPIFRGLMISIRYHEKLAAALLPYLVAEALCSGDENDAIAVTEELKAALHQDQGIAVDPLVYQHLFVLRATLDAWCEEARQIEREAPGLSMRSHDSSQLSLVSSKKKRRRKDSLGAADAPIEILDDDEDNDDILLEDAEREEPKVSFISPFDACFNAEAITQKAGQRSASERLEIGVTALPLKALARVAERMGAFARALMYAERSLRFRGLEARLSAPVGTVFKDRADGFVPAMQRDDIEELQRLAAQLEDTDYLAGLAASRRVAGFSSTLVQKVREHECAREWREALHGYDHLLTLHFQGEDTVTIPLNSAARGLLKCQLELGQLESVLVAADGLAADTTTSLRRLAPLAAEAAWRLGRWSRLDRLLKEESADDEEDGLALARCVAALRPECASINLEDAVTKARLYAVDGLSAASMESYARAYPYLERLACLREIEHAAKLLDVQPGEAREHLYDTTIAQRWNARLQAAAPDTAANMLSLRRTCLEMAGLSADAADCCLLAARLARKSGSAPLAETQLIDAARLGASSEALLVADAKLALARNNNTLAAFALLEPVALDVMKTREALGMTQQGNEQPGVNSRRQKSVTGYDSTRRAIAKRLLLATDCLVDAGLQHGNDVVQRYKLVSELRPTWDRAYFSCAKYFDTLVANRRRELIAGDDTAVGAFVQGVLNYDIIAHDYVKNAMQWYATGLEYGAKHAQTALARLLTLWFEFAAIEAQPESNKKSDNESQRDTSKRRKSSHQQLPATSSKEEVQQPQRNIHSLQRLQCLAMETVKKVRRNVPAAVLYAAVPQLVSRAGHPHSDIQEGVEKLLAKVVEVHPEQTLWSVVGLHYSTNEKRKEMGKRVLASAAQQLKKKGRHRAVRTLDAAKTLFRDLISLARYNPGDCRTMSLDDHRQLRLPAEADFLIPTRSALTPELPSNISQLGHNSRSARRAAVASTSNDFQVEEEEEEVLKPVFPETAPRIRRFESGLDVLQSKAKPKKLTAQATDGRRVRMLCKCEREGDLRKDARLNDFNDVVNRLLAADGGARLRKLRLRTYYVVVLDEECGLCEWVQQTDTMRNCLMGAYCMRKQLRHVSALFSNDATSLDRRRDGYVRRRDFVSYLDRQRIRQPFEALQQQHAHDVHLMAEAYRRDILSRFAPCLSVWFDERFGAEPAAWLEARAVFARSAAAWAAVGHVVGLGDRHAENILLDITTGECVHVDFDCLFDKGCSLTRPEVVPFRLTPHMVEALGISGVDGAFRTALHATLDVLRTNKATLLNVLEPFLRDPTVGWARLGKAQRDDEIAASGRKRGRDDIPARRSKREDPHKTLATIAGRLSGIYNLPVKPPPGTTRDVQSGGSRNPTDLLPLSVAGQVERLINEASSEYNLCRMYIGWMPWL